MYHYLRRRPPNSYSFGLFDSHDKLMGVCILGTPPSRHLQISLCPANPSLVIELNRLWVHDVMPGNTESWFIAQVLKQLPPKIICSFADTVQNHLGIIYRASNWFYAGVTDADRKTPRFDYVSPGKHSRDAFRTGYVDKVRRKPKHRYWTVTGNRREKHNLTLLCNWPKLPWK